MSADSDPKNVGNTSNFVGIPTMSKIDRETPIKCAKCGEDLTGKGSMEKGGKVYCLKPGCGYSAREDGQ